MISEIATRGTTQVHESHWDRQTGTAPTSRRTRRSLRRRPSDDSGRPCARAAARRRPGLRARRPSPQCEGDSRSGLTAILQPTTTARQRDSCLASRSCSWLALPGLAAFAVGNGDDLRDVAQVIVELMITVRQPVHARVGWRGSTGRYGPVTPFDRLARGIGAPVLHAAASYQGL